MSATDPAVPVAVVIAAMAEEAEAFAKLGDHSSDPDALHKSDHQLVSLGHATIALIRSGIGFANATGAAAYAFHTFGAHIPVISIGTAGGLATDVELGDIIVGERYLNLNADATAFGYALGQVPGMPEDYEGDQTLIERILFVGQDAPLAARTIGSSEIFVTASRAIDLRSAFPTVAAVDMESAAIAQFTHRRGTPFVSVRAISDLCAPDGNEFLSHLDHAAARAAKVVAAALAV